MEQQPELEARIRECRKHAAVPRFSYGLLDVRVFVAVEHAPDLVEGIVSSLAVRLHLFPSPPNEAHWHESTVTVYVEAHGPGRHEAQIRWLCDIAFGQHPDHSPLVSKGNAP